MLVPLLLHPPQPVSTCVPTHCGASPNAQTSEEQATIIRENADMKAHLSVIESKVRTLIREKTDASLALLTTQERLRQVCV